MRPFRILLTAAVVLLASCATLLGPRQLDVPLSRLQASIDKRFPFNNRYLELFDMALSAPRLALQPGTNRVITTLDASMSPAWMKKSWQGKLILSGMLAIDQPRNAVVLIDPRIEQINLDGLDPAYASQLGRIGSLLAEQLFRDMPLYFFHPQDFRYTGTSFSPTKIQTTADGLVVTFEPIR